MNLFISNLNFRVGDNELHELFAAYGEVLSAKVIKDKFTGRSKGFGFVEMSDEEAETAIKELNQAEYDGKVINVNEARPREEKPRNNNNRNFRKPNGGGYKRDNNKRW
jgi:RNA recognition motif-containing protein